MDELTRISHTGTTAGDGYTITTGWDVPLAVHATRDQALTALFHRGLIPVAATLWGSDFSADGSPHPVPFLHRHRHRHRRRLAGVPALPRQPRRLRALRRRRRNRPVRGLRRRGLARLRPRLLLLHQRRGACLLHARACRRTR